MSRAACTRPVSPPRSRSVSVFASPPRVDAPCTTNLWSHISQFEHPRGHPLQLAVQITVRGISSQRTADDRRNACHSCRGGVIPRRRPVRAPSWIPSLPPGSPGSPRSPPVKPLRALSRTLRDRCQSGRSKPPSRTPSRTHHLPHDRGHGGRPDPGSPLSPRSACPFGPFGRKRTGCGSGDARQRRRQRGR